MNKKMIPLRAELLNRRVPRYTSYPPATAFSTATGADFQGDCLRNLDPDVPVSVYVHIPFCERLCWFCACRTQGTRTLSPVESYLDSVLAELDLMRRVLPKGLRMGRLHWGGGTPTILTPPLIRKLAGALYALFEPAENFEFSVEIDPTLVDEPKISALADMGMTRASIGIQDFAPEVQQAIGRMQSFEDTKACVDALRAAGIASVNADLVYGLPHQTPDRFARSIDQVLTLSADRLALFGYAHVPHMSKRQKLIDETALPDDTARAALAAYAAERFRDAGYQGIGIDHFAKPHDGLALAASNGDLRRNFQGYTDERCPTLIGIGASSISQFHEGYVQNAAATAAYNARIASGSLAGTRGHAHSQDDRLRARAIEMLMCRFAIDVVALKAEFGGIAGTLDATHDSVIAEFEGIVTRDATGLSIDPKWRHLTRVIAHAYDAYGDIAALYSRVS